MRVTAENNAVDSFCQSICIFSANHFSNNVSESTGRRTFPRKPHESQPENRYDIKVHNRGEQ